MTFCVNIRAANSFLNFCNVAYQFLMGLELLEAGQDPLIVPKIIKIDVLWFS